MIHILIDVHIHILPHTLLAVKNETNVDIRKAVFKDTAHNETHEHDIQVK